jgi:hypothetical protein
MPAARRGNSSKALYVATSSGVANVDGVEYAFRAGQTHVREGHPLLNVASMYFEPAEDRVVYDTEAMSDAPGEKRGDQDK